MDAVAVAGDAVSPPGAGERTENVLCGMVEVVGLHRLELWTLCV